MFKKRKKLSPSSCNDQKEKLDRLGLKSDLSDWNCYEVLNVPGKLPKPSS